MDPVLVRDRDAARALSISVSKLYDLRKRGVITEGVFILGGTTRYDVEAIVRQLREKCS
jgi:hypothetical protein